MKRRATTKPKPKTKTRPKPKTKTVPTKWPADPAYEAACELVLSAPAEAVKQLEAALKRQPKRARIHVNLATALTNLGRHSEAVKAAEKAHRLDPHDGYLAARRVFVLHSADDDRVADAARHAMQCADVDEDDRLYAHKALCWSLMRTTPTAALLETEKLVASSPKNAEALAARGCAFAGVCRYDEGLVWLEKAIAVAPDDGWFTARRDQILQARIFAEQSIASLREQTVSDPADADAWRELGLGLAKFARLEEALAAFDHANELSPPPTRRKPKQLVLAALMVEATARSSVAIGDIAPIG